MANQKLLIFLEYVSIAVCMGTPFHNSGQKNVLYCTDENCMKCNITECTLPIKQGCFRQNNILSICENGNWRILQFNGKTPNTQTSISKQHHIVHETLRRSEQLSCQNYGLHLCESKENTLSSECLYVMPYHQANISINGNSTVKSGNCSLLSVDYPVNVRENDLVNVSCQPGGNQHWKCPDTNNLPDTGKPFKVSRGHSECNFQCSRSVNEDFTCTINIKLEVILSHTELPSDIKPTERLPRFDSKTTTERLLTSDSKKTTERLLKSEQSGHRTDITKDPKNPTRPLDFVLISLIVVVILLIVLLLLKSKRDSRTRRSKSTKSDSTTRNSSRTSITHTYAMTGCSMEETSLQINNEEMNNSTPILNLRRNSFQSSETSKGLRQTQNSYIPGGVITPYAVTSICGNSLKRNNALPRAPEGSLNTYGNVKKQKRAKGDQDQQD